MTQQIIIDGRFCGPPDSGNGGYTCGVLSRFIQGDAEVTLISPPPLNRMLTVEHADEGMVVLKDGESMVAKAVPKVLDFDTPIPPAFEEAFLSATDSAVMGDHPFPTCFVCGHHRQVNDGLRLFPGPVQGKPYLATTWVPDPTLCDEQGMVKREFIWAALDCPGAWAIIVEKMRFIVLGRLAVQIQGTIKAGDRCIVTGWKMSEQGRKIMAGTAVFSETGRLCAQALATWIELI